MADSLILSEDYRMFSSFSEDKTKVCKHERTPDLFTSTPILMKPSHKTTGGSKWPYNVVENSGVSATVYQMDGTFDKGSVRESKNNSVFYCIYSALKLHLTVLVFHVMFHVT